MPIRQQLEGEWAPVLVYTDEVDHATREQLRRIAALPIIHHHVAAMPDAHLGRGATVGAVIPTREAIIPAAVGVDIGCGMTAARLSLEASYLPDNLRPMRQAIESVVPLGQASHQSADAPMAACRPLQPGLRKILDEHPVIGEMGRNMDRKWIEQMGTLGGGNHFIEVCLDESGQVWVMLHSGSRGVGNAIGRYFIELARDDMRVHNINLPDRDLAYLREGTRWFDDYVAAVEWAQHYAHTNRQVMLGNILGALGRVLPTFEVTDEVIDCHHNYIARETHYGKTVWVTRKGAIRAGRDDLGIIPGSMGARSYIVRGLGSADAFDSCAHGAGRAMSRRQAKERISLAEFRAQTRHVECRKDRSVLDESPGAYKDINQVMANQSDLVESLHELRQIVCVKG
ncbi:RtcB family protein [Aquisalimonas sp.]|uniref:RtcB family protein n=1 Tax=Aquisalimonas sp. TaxID=1872621 RepID=UPI0025C1575B|nr:RtcB family protein [Aquisalimonas sp.]